MPQSESEEEIEVPDSGSEIEIDDDQEFEYEYSKDDESAEPSPEREVFIKKSRSADRNRRRRYRRKVARDQEKKHVTERIDATHPKMRLGKGATKNTRQKPRTSSTEILSDDDARAKPRLVNPKTRRERFLSIRKERQESREEEDVQDTKVPKNKKKSRRQ